MGLTPPTLFVTSIEADFALMHRVNTREGTCKSKSLSLYFSKKLFFEKAGRSKTTKDGVSLHGWSDSQKQ